MSQISFASSFASQTLSKTGSATPRQNNFQSQIDETNSRIDNLLRNRQDMTTEQRDKLEAFRKQFNDRMNSMRTGGADNARGMSEYRDARRELSDNLATLFGGPRTR